MITKILKHILFFCFFIPGIGFTQTPNSPILKQVAVDSIGNVTIYWDMSPPSKIYIATNNPDDKNLTTPGWLELDSVPDNVTQYTHYGAGADTSVRMYNLKSSLSNNPSEKFPTTLLQHRLDTCNNSVLLEWTNFVDSLYGSGDVSFTYEVYRNKNNEGYTPITSADTAKSFIDTNIEDGATYKYYIASTPNHYPSLKSISNQIQVNSDIRKSPAYISPVSAIADNQSTHLKFIIDPDTEINKYLLTKTESLNSPFRVIDSIISTSTELTFTDVNSASDSKVSYYQLASVNNCGVTTTTSDTILNNLLLQLENNQNIISLNWNKFNEHYSISADYEIYRIVNTDAPVLLRSFSNFYFLEDDLTTESGGGQFCYYIQAKNQHSLTNDYSKSNTVCVFLEPPIYIPEAFTPNNDGKNDIFKPQFSFIPKSYELRVYNRWGNIIYQTRNAEEGWNGTELNNKPAPTGTCIYYLKIKLPDNQTIEKRGNITVIHP